MSRILIGNNKKRKVYEEGVTPEEERVRVGGIMFVFQRGERRSITHVWVNLRDYPIEYVYDKDITDVSVEYRNSILTGRRFLVTAPFMVPCKWRRNIKSIVKGISETMVAQGLAKGLSDDEVVAVCNAIFSDKENKTQSVYEKQ